MVWGSACSHLSSAEAHASDKPHTLRYGLRLQASALQRRRWRVCAERRACRAGWPCCHAYRRAHSLGSCSPAFQPKGASMLST